MGKVAQEKHTILNALVADNVKPGIIAKTLGYTPEHTSRLIAKSKSYQLITTKRVKRAAAVIDYFGDVKNYQEDTRIKPSDAISAAKEYLLRSHPIVQQIQSQSITMVISEEMTIEMRKSLERQGLL